jgi:tRNA(Ile)-lysidine synthase
VPAPEALLLDAVNLRKLPLAAARRLVRHAIEQVKGDLLGIGFEHVNGILDMATASEGHSRLQAPGLDVIRSFTWLRFARPVSNGLATRNYRFPASVPGVFRVPGTALEICLEIIEKSNSSGDAISVYNETMGVVDWRRLSGSLEWRNWRPGDQYQPQGARGAEKIKTLFQQFRVPLWERRHWPVLTDGPAIVWAHQFGTAASYVADSATPRILAIREKGIVPELHSVYKNKGHFSRNSGRED